MPRFLDHFFMGPDDVLVYLSLHLFLERRETVKMAPTSFIWRIRFFLLLVEIIDAVGLVELVVCLHQPLLDGYCKAESGFCRPVVMLDLTACIPGKFGFDRILTGVLQ